MIRSVISDKISVWCIKIFICVWDSLCQYKTLNNLVWRCFFIPFGQIQNLCSLRCSCCCRHCSLHFCLLHSLLHPHPWRRPLAPLKVREIWSTANLIFIAKKRWWKFCESTKISISGFYIEIVNIGWHSGANQHLVTVSIILFHVIRPRTEILYQYQGKSFQGQPWCRHHDQYYFKLYQTLYGSWEARKVTWY